MSSDGAHLGYGPEESMKALVGGEQPTEQMTAEEMRNNILATTEADANTYDGCGLYAAKLILLWLLADPSRAQGPPENIYEKDADGKMKWPAVVTERGWYDRMKADGIKINELDLTGFMWGWAVNAARRCLELPPEPNPAII